jgi:phosphoglycolate phosphatase
MPGFRAALPHTVIFDLDGTLVDTGPDLTAALNHSLVSIGRAPVAPDRVAHLVGHGARRLIERGLEEQGGGSDAEVNAAFPLFMAYYAENICVGSTPYPGVLTALDALREADVTMAICTNKPVAMSEALLRALGLERYFAANLGGDSLTIRKPDPEHLFATIRAARGDPARTVFVGDSIVDTDTGYAAGIPVVAVSFGFADRPVQDLGAAAVIHHFDELLPTLSALTMPA